MKRKKNKNINAVITVVGIFFVLAIMVGVFMATRETAAKPTGDDSTSQSQNSVDSGETDQLTSSKTQSESTLQSSEVAPPIVQNTNKEYRAVWISYLEYQAMNMSSRDGFVKDITTAFTNCANMGLNTVIVQVRPFGDALYNSEIFPQSHLLTGTQGQSAGYDPLKEMVDIAHGLGLKIEAWINPYRAKLSSKMPANLAASNPANDTSIVFDVNGGIYYNPALPKVQDLVINGVAEIVQNYDIDGIHLDDYFYPTTDLSIDKADYDLSSKDYTHADWRRENVNNLIRNMYAKIKSIKPDVTLGISPQGNNDNNYNSQYSDVNLWLSTPGYADYIMPQLYWGFGYLTKSGREDFQFAKLSKQWASYPRHENVKLYLGLGAYRIGEGDGGYNEQSEWDSGKNLADMINLARSTQGISGCALYRYDNLFKNPNETLAKSEVDNLTAAYK